MNDKKMTPRYSGKVVLVTGGGSGIGESCCRRFADEGASVVVLDFDAANGERVAASLRKSGSDAAFFICDVTDASAVELAVADVVRRFGRLDVAVNNAGIAGALQPITEYPVETWNRVIATNLSGVFHGLRAQIPVMVKQGGGAIINLASLMGTVGYPGIAAYVAAKHGVLGLTKVAALEWGAHKVRVNAVAPSWIKTPLTTGALPEEAWQSLADMHALKRCAEPAEIAALVAFLGSDEASYLTGATYLADGGYTAI